MVTTNDSYNENRIQPKYVNDTSLPPILMRNNIFSHIAIIIAANNTTVVFTGKIIVGCLPPRPSGRLKI